MATIDELLEQYDAENSSSNEASVDYGNDDYSGGETYQSNSSEESTSSNEPEKSAKSIDDLLNEFNTHSEQQAAQQANGGQSYVQTAVQDVTGQQAQAPEQQKLGLFEKPEIKTTPERDALIEEYNNLGNPNYLHTKAERDAYIQKHDELLGQLRAIDEELGNGAMDYNFRDRSQSVLGGSLKGYGADMMNAGATVLSGFNELGERLGGDTGQYAGWATDEVSRAAIPQENNPDIYAQQKQEVADMQAKSDELAQASAADLERAKNNQSKFAQFGTDIATNAIQMGMDALAAGLTGGSSLAPMFVRSAGGGAREARQDGASTAEQLTYGAVRGGIEVATEKMFDGLAKIYGAGFADDAIEKLIGKLGQGNKLVQSGLRWMFSGLGEAAEEGVSGLSEPLTKMIYQGIDALKEYKDPEYWAENMYGMLVGYAMGGAGGAVNLVNGENRKANAEIQKGIDQRNEIKNNLIENNGMSEEDATKASEILAKIANGEKINQKQKAFLDTLQEANGIDTSKPSTAAPQAEAAQATTPQVETPAAPTPQTQAQQSDVTAQPTTESASTPTPSASQPNVVQEGITYNKENAGRRITSYNGFEVSGYKNEANWMQTTTLKAPDGSTITVRHGNNPARGNAAIKDAVDNWYKAHPEYTLSSQASGQSTQITAPQSSTIDERRAKAREDYINAVLEQYPGYRNTAESEADSTLGKLQDRIKEGSITFSNAFAPGDQAFKDSGMKRKVAAVNDYLKTLGYQLDVDNVKVVEKGNPNNDLPGWTFPIVPYQETASSQNSAAPQSTPQGNPSPSASPQNPTQQPTGTTPQQGGENAQGTSQNASQQPSGELNSESGESGGGTGGAWIPPVNNPSETKQKVSQTSTNSMRNTAEQNGATQEDLYYTTKSEYESLTNAMARVDADKVGEMDKLTHKEMWTGEDGDAAHIIYSQLAKEFANNPNDPEIKKAYESWGKILQEHKTRNAQALQASAKWARSGASALLDINAEIDASENLSDEEKETLKKDVAKFMTDYDNIDENDSDAADKYRKLILEQNNYRRTGTFFNANFEKLLNKETDVNWLKEYARRQALNIPSDYTQKPTLGQQLKTWQVCAQLSRVGTFFRNLGGNFSFGGIDTFAQDAFGYAIDSFVSKKTGRKEVGFDKGWLSKNARESAVKAFERSVLEVAGDVDMTGDANRYGQGSSRTNKMAGGGKVQQAMSRWEQLLGYSLTSSDRFFRGQIEQSVYDGLMQNNPNMTEEEARQIAKETADYRLFQNDGIAAGISKGVHNLFNLAGVGGEVSKASHGREGGFGLGDLINPYPGVPANLAVKALEYSPANIVKGGVEIVKLLNDTKAGKATNGQQMQAVMDIARGMSGVPIIALFTALAKSGLFKNSDDEDYDVSAEEAAQNLSGVQWNLSATLRRFNGESPEWKDGDNIMKVSWLEPLNAFMGIASMLAESDEDQDLESLSSTFFEGAIKAALDMPVMENIQNAINTFKYSQGDTLWQKGLEAGAQFAGDALGGMIPAPISQTARVTDDYVRDTRGDSKAETAYNAFLNSIPGMRNTLPVKTDNFGNARENEPDMYNRFMNSFVRPGAISTYRETAVQDEIGKLYKEMGDVALYPDRNGPKSIKVDGIDYPLSAEESRAYHEFVGQKSEEFVQALVDNKAYKTLTTEQKAKAVKEMYSLANGLAKDAYISGNGIKTDTTSDATKLLGGVNKAGTSNDKTALNESNLANYVVYTESFNSSLKNGNYKDVDTLAKWYNDMDSNLKTVLLERNTDLKRVLEYQKIGLGSETYTKIKETIPDAQNELDANSSTGSLVRLYGVAKADIPEKDRLKVLEQLVQGDNGFIGSNAKAAVSTMKQYGLSVEQTAQFFDIALHCATYKDTGDAKDFKGKLTPENTAYALSQIPGMTDAQRTAAYNAIRSEVSNYYNDWGTYTYASEVKWFTNPKNKAVYGTNIKISPKGQNALLASAS